MAKFFEGATIEDVDLTTCDENSFRRLEAAYASHIPQYHGETARP